MNTPLANQNIITRLLPKTGQTISYQAGDDGDYEAGWWKRRSSLNNLIRFKVPADNPDVVVDRATGLMWVRNHTGAGGNGGAAANWANAIIFCEALNFAGFTDWRMANINEIFSLIYHRAGAIDPLFQNPNLGAYYWSSTTSWTTTTAALASNFNGQITNLFPKIMPAYILPCRKIA